MGKGAVVPDLEAGGAGHDHRVLVLHAVREHDDVTLRDDDDVGCFEGLDGALDPAAHRRAVGGDSGALGEVTDEGGQVRR